MLRFFDLFACFSNILSYWSRFHIVNVLLFFCLGIYSSTSNVENNGFEPLTPCVQGRCSSQLS